MLVNVSVVSVPTTVVVASGNVIVLSSVGCVAVNVVVKSYSKSSQKMIELSGISSSPLPLNAAGPDAAPSVEARI